jgi:hypothetical protein
MDVVSGNAGPMSVGGYPGAIGQKEAVFEVGSGSYSFSGPALGPNEMGVDPLEGGHAAAGITPLA